MLGKGAFGTVYAAQHLKTGKTYAVKCIDKSKLVTEARARAPQLALPRWRALTSVSGAAQEDREDVRREVEVLNLVSDHANVAELVEVFEDSKAISLVLELCQGGELFDRVVAKGTFTERMAAGEGLWRCRRCPAGWRQLPLRPRRADPWRAAQTTSAPW